MLKLFTKPPWVESWSPSLKHQATVDISTQLFQASTHCFSLCSLAFHPAHVHFRNQLKIWVCMQIWGFLHSSSTSTPFLWNFPCSVFSSSESPELWFWVSSPARLPHFLECILHGHGHLEVVVKMCFSISVFSFFQGTNVLQLLPAFGHSSVPSNDWFLYFVQILELSLARGLVCCKIL